MCFTFVQSDFTTYLTCLAKIETAAAMLGLVLHAEYCSESTAFLYTSVLLSNGLLFSQIFWLPVSTGIFMVCSLQS